MYAFNILTDEEIHFDDATSAEYAVVYGYCEQHNMMSNFFSHCHSLTLPELYKTLPMTYGRMSTACGDWAAKNAE